MREPSADHRLAERADGSFLSDDVIEGKRSELPVEYYMFFHKLSPLREFYENRIRPARTAAGKASPRRTLKSAYCCFLPDLTGFTAQCRTGP